MGVILAVVSWFYAIQYLYPIFISYLCFYSNDAFTRFFPASPPVVSICVVVVIIASPSPLTATCASSYEHTLQTNTGLPAFIQCGDGGLGVYNITHAKIFFAANWPRTCSQEPSTHEVIQVMWPYEVLLGRAFMCRVGSLYAERVEKCKVQLICVFHLTPILTVRREVRFIIFLNTSSSYPRVPSRRTPNCLFIYNPHTWFFLMKNQRIKVN